VTDEDRCVCPSPSTCSYCSRMYPCDCAGCDVKTKTTESATERTPAAWIVISDGRTIYVDFSYTAAAQVASRENVNGHCASTVPLWEDAPLLDQAFLDGYGACYTAMAGDLIGSRPGRFVAMAEWKAESEAALAQWHKDIAGEPGDGGEEYPSLRDVVEGNDDHGCP